MTRLTVRAPASTANLGPGFDTFGMALGLHDVVEAELTGSGMSVEVLDAGAGDMSGVPTTERHLVVRAFRRAAEHLGLAVPGLALRCHNAIPHARGLGSSSAAVVAGIGLAYGFAGVGLDDEKDAALRLAVEFEGHADNAAACLHGGFVVTWDDGGAAASPSCRAVRLEPHPGVRPIVAVPAQRSSTDVTRGLLPQRIPYADAVFSASRTALAVHAITAAPELLLAATEDRLHQSYRESAYPASLRLVSALRERGVAAAVSGAGPTVLALPSDGIIPSEVDVAGFDVLELPVDLDGVCVTLD